MSISAPDAFPDDRDLNVELLSDKVYGLIRAAILDGSQPPNGRLVESEMARRLGVSQAPVREAIKKLVHEGLVYSIPRRGSYVVEVLEADAAAAREVRATVEKVAAAALCELGDAEARERLRAIAGRMATQARADDLAGVRLLDIEFHRTLCESAGLPLLSRLWAQMEPVLVSQRAISDPGFHGSWESIAREHNVLVDILQAGDPIVAGQAFQDHANGVRPLD